MNTIELYRKQLLKALKRKDVESFEDLENIENYDENYESLRMRGGFGLPLFKSASRPHMPGLPGNPSAQAYVAQYDFKIYYLSHRERITKTLPVPIFMPLFTQSLYRGCLDLPQNILLTNVSLNENLVIDYVDTSVAGSQAKIVVEGLTSDYTSLHLGILSSEEYEISKIRLTCTEGFEQEFFNTYIKAFGRTSLGKVYQQDTIPFISQKSPLQFAKNILDIDVKVHIQKDSGLIYGMPSAEIIGDNAPVTFSLFITKLNRK